LDPIHDQHIELMVQPGKDSHVFTTIKVTF